MLKFGAETARLLEVCYQGAEITRRRQASFDALHPAPGDTILDIGCGNGMLTEELARAVGAQGRVIGVDPSSDMLDAGRKRCAAFDQVTFQTGTAGDIPVTDGTADKAVSLQVFEYLDDIPAALREAHRVLKPGGRLAIGDNHFDTFAWFSEDPDRMQRMLVAWDHHLTERCVPAILPDLMRAAGFEVASVTPVTFSDTLLKPDGLAIMMLQVMERYVIENSLMSAEEAGAWRAEQYALAEQGRFFFSLTHFVISARKI